MRMERSYQSHSTNGFGAWAEARQNFNMALRWAFSPPSCGLLAAVLLTAIVPQQHHLLNFALLEPFLFVALTFLRRFALSAEIVHRRSLLSCETRSEFAFILHIGISHSTVSCRFWNYLICRKGLYLV